MLRTLRITSFISIIAAAGTVVFVMIFGWRQNAEVQAFLEQPSIVEQLKKTTNTMAQKVDAVSPLVTQAAAFALRIDPPPPPPPPPQPKSVDTTQPPVQPPVTPQGAGVTPPPKTVKFDLVATAKYKSHPEKSLALLNMVSEGYKWYRQGETVGRFTIHEVKEGSIVLYQNGKKDTELFVPPPAPVKSLLKADQTMTSITKGPSSVSEQPAGAAQLATSHPATGIEPVLSDANGGDATGAVRITRTASPTTTSIVPIRQPRQPEPEPTIEDRKQSLDESISGIKQLMGEAREGQTEAERQEENKAWVDLLKILQQEKENLEKESAAETKNPADSAKSKTK
ncbi:MAG TPA: hypothetical protein PKB02_06425 [Anaerohalosphaeraceae bacterium]|nr:hypothetical protein [Anaerohalosphaeraceae bacterium]